MNASIYDMQGKNLALAFRFKSLIRFKQLAPRELIRSLSCNAKREFGVQGATM